MYPSASGVHTSCVSVILAAVGPATPLVGCEIAWSCVGGVLSVGAAGGDACVGPLHGMVQCADVLQINYVLAHSTCSINIFNELILCILYPCMCITLHTLGVVLYALLLTFLSIVKKFPCQ